MGRRSGYSPSPIASTGRERSARRVGSARASSASSAETPQRLGYLLKDRVTDPADFAVSLRRVARGGTALDPQVVSGLLADPEEQRRLGSLSPRERSVLELVAEGRSNKAIAERLAITHGAVQKHVSTIFNKLDLPAGEDDDRRTLAVLAYVRPELHPSRHRLDATARHRL